VAPSAGQARWLAACWWTQSRCGWRVSVRFRAYLGPLAHRETPRVAPKHSPSVGGESLKALVAASDTQTCPLPTATPSGALKAGPDVRWTRAPVAISTSVTELSARSATKASPFDTPRATGSSKPNAEPRAVRMRAPRIDFGHGVSDSVCHPDMVVIAGRSQTKLCDYSFDDDCRHRLLDIIRRIVPSQTPA
jgi:hypothetical protein